MATNHVQEQHFWISWWGTSYVEGIEAHSPRLIDATDRPRVGESVMVT
ncbi:hypothetical protein OG874_33440 [Nocardia sp. NBC_00565]|nr:hypothetical protein [Nocardia sp. NBC_00565]WUC01651.1 hypothetical protein OG874_33440 [Nocardia sp. NBC_00565]